MEIILMSKIFADLLSYLSRSERKAWKIQAWTGLESLRCRCIFGVCEVSSSHWGWTLSRYIRASKPQGWILFYCQIPWKIAYLDAVWASCLQIHKDLFQSVDRLHHLRATFGTKTLVDLHCWGSLLQPEKKDGRWLKYDWNLFILQ